MLLRAVLCVCLRASLTFKAVRGVLRVNLRTTEQKPCNWHAQGSNGALNPSERVVAARRLELRLNCWSKSQWASSFFCMLLLVVPSCSKTIAIMMISFHFLRCFFCFLKSKQTVKEWNEKPIGTVQWLPIAYVYAHLWKVISRLKTANVLKQTSVYVFISVCRQTNIVTCVCETQRRCFEINPFPPPPVRL